MHFRRIQLRDDFDTADIQEEDGQLLTKSKAKDLKNKKKRFSMGGTANDLDTGLSAEQKLRVRNKQQAAKQKSENEQRNIERVDEELEALFAQ